MRRILMVLALSACTSAYSEEPTPDQPLTIRDVVTEVYTVMQTNSSTTADKIEAACLGSDILTGGGCRCVADPYASVQPALVSCLPNGSRFEAECDGTQDAIEVRAICMRTKVINVVARRYGDMVTFPVDGPRK